MYSSIVTAPAIFPVAAIPFLMIFLLLRPDPAIQSLKRRGLIEGRKPNFRVAAGLATDPESKATYLRHRAFDDDYYRKLILEYLKEFGEAKRADFEILLMDKLSDGLSEEQKRWKIANMIQTLRKKGQITADKNARSAKWRLSHPNEGE